MVHLNSVQSHRVVLLILYGSCWSRYGLWVLTRWCLWPLLYGRDTAVTRQSLITWEVLIILRHCKSLPFLLCMSHEKRSHKKMATTSKGHFTPACEFCLRDFLKFEFSLSGVYWLCVKNIYNQKETKQKYLRAFLYQAIAKSKEILLK